MKIRRPAFSRSTGSLAIALALASHATFSAAQGAAPQAAANSGAVVVQTKPGAMVSRIAAAHRPAGASIDQMLVAILQANPDAFMAGNINLLKKGAALTMPAASAVLATPAADARRQIQQQNADYEKHGYKLVQGAAVGASGAEGATTAPAATGATTAASTPSAKPAENTASGAAGPATGATSTASATQAGPASAPTAPASVAASTPVATPASTPASDAGAAIGSASNSSGPASVPVVTNAPASTPAVVTSATDAASPASAPSTTSSPMLWAAIIGLPLLALLGWFLMRVRRIREEDRLAAEAAAAEPTPRAAAEALARVWDADRQPGNDDNAVATEPAQQQTSAATAEIDGLTLDLSGMQDVEGADTNRPAPKTFDFSNISLDLDEPEDTESALQTKLELAREFFTISDHDGARVLAQEVADKSTGELQTQARQLLQDIANAEQA